MTNLLQENRKMESQPHKLHIWFFADTQANSKKPKEQFLANARQKTSILQN